MADSPWRLDPSKCTKCGACERACNHGVLDCSADGTPGLPRQRADRYCNRCGHCVAVCASDAITVSGVSGNAPSDLKVGVSIDHTYVGDLTIRLVAPDGSTYTLRNRTGGSANDIDEVYTVDASSESANGTWKLRVTDAYWYDSGKLDLWSLQV